MSFLHKIPVAFLLPGCLLVLCFVSAVNERNSGTPGKSAIVTSGSSLIFCNVPLSNVIIKRERFIIGTIRLALHSYDIFIIYRMKTNGRAMWILIMLTTTYKIDPEWDLRTVLYTASPMAGCVDSIGENSSLEVFRLVPIANISSDGAAMK